MLDRLIKSYKNVAKFVLYSMPVSVQCMFAFVTLSSLVFAPFIANAFFVLVFSYLLLNLPDEFAKKDTSENNSEVE